MSILKTKEGLIYSLIAVVIIITLATITIKMILSPPSDPPDFTGELPSPNNKHVISHTEEIVVDLPLAEYSKWVDNEPLEEGVQNNDGLPSVVDTKVIKGEEDKAGFRRLVILSDGHYTAEEFLVRETELFRYQVWGFTNVLRFVIDYAIGEFQFKEIDGKTHVKWIYSFHQKSGLTNIFFSNFVEKYWANMMRNYLEHTKENSEKDLKKIN